MNDVMIREVVADAEWESPQQAADTLEKFCIFLNYYFQGEICDMEMSDIW